MKFFCFSTFSARPYRICRKTGAVEYETPQKLWITAGFHEVLSIYDMLCNPNGKPVLSGSWSPVGNLGRMPNASEAVGESSLSTYGKYFTGKGKELTEICQSLGGSPAPVGDAAFYLPVFDFFPICRFVWSMKNFLPSFSCSGTKIPVTISIMKLLFILQRICFRLY